MSHKAWPALTALPTSVTLATRPPWTGAGTVGSYDPATAALDGRRQGGVARSAQIGAVGAPILEWDGGHGGGHHAHGGAGIGLAALFIVAFPAFLAATGEQ